MYGDEKCLNKNVVFFKFIFSTSGRKANINDKKKFAMFRIGHMSQCKFCNSLVACK